MLTLLALLCALALTLAAGCAESEALDLPLELAAVEAGEDGLWIEGDAFELPEGDVLSLPGELDLGDALEDGIWVGGIDDAPAAVEAAAANDGEDYWTKDQFEAWYEGEQETAKSADHVLGEGGDLFARSLTVILPGETIAVVPDAGISDSAYAKYGYLTFDFTVYQLDNPKVVTQYGGYIDLLPRTGTPAKTTLKALKTQKLRVPYRAASTFSGVEDGGLKDFEYVSLYENDTGHPIAVAHDEWGTNSEVVGYMKGEGENNLGRYVMTGRGTLMNQPIFHFLESYYEISYDYGDVDPSELYFPAGAPAAYADRIYLDAEDHTYQMPRPVRKGYIFNGWNDWDTWGWDYLPSHESAKRTVESTGTVGELTEDSYTYSMNFAKYAEEKKYSVYYGCRDAKLKAQFIAVGYAGYQYYGSLTVGFNPQGGTVKGQKYYICETRDLNSRSFDLDIGKIKPVREGYAFKGWCTDPKDEAGTLIKDTSPDSASAWTQDGHTEVYAVWQSNTPTTISLAKAKIAAIKAQTYTGKAIKPAVTVTLSGKTLKKGADYTVAYKNNTNARKATVTVKGKGDYTGTVSASFKINPASLAKAKLAAIKAQTYTGKAIKPAVKVTLSGKALKKGTDYTVSYKNNKAIGKATATVKGKGNYKGSVSKTFAINPKAVALSSLTAGKQALTVKWKKAAGSAGYQLQYSLKKSFASATTVTITRNGTVKTTLKDLKSGKTYYVRIRAYKKVGGAAYTSAWSKALSKKTK